MKTYPLFRVHMPVDAVMVRIKEVLESGYLNEGEQVTALTLALRMHFNTEHLVLTNSCTSALTMALRLAGVGPGDDVISTPMTCIATNAAVASSGARIIWADVDPRHGMLDPDDVARRITPETKAVVAVAWAGTPPDMGALTTVCSHHGIKLILDAAHALDASYRGAPVHRWADYTAYSFQAIKHLTTGDGGALVCAYGVDHERAKALKWFGIDRDKAKDTKGDWKGQQWDVDIDEIGYKFNMNNVAAAIGLAQLPHIPYNVGRHQHNATVYDRTFDGYDLVRANVRPEGAESSHWVYAMHVNLNSSSLTRDELLAALNREGIMAGVVHVPNDTYTCFKRFQANLPGVRAFGESQFSLPCGWWLNDADIEHIALRTMELVR